MRDMYPESIIDPFKHQLYLKLRKEVDKLVEDMAIMSHLEWRIDKRLIEESGLGKTLYYIPARGGCRMNWDMVNKLADECREIKLVLVSDYKPYTLDPKVVRDAMEAFKLDSLMREPMRDPLYKPFRDYDLVRIPYHDYEHLLNRTYLGPYINSVYAIDREEADAWQMDSHVLKGETNHGEE